jgi:hypothetical protein
MAPKFFIKKKIFSRRSRKSSNLGPTHIQRHRIPMRWNNQVPVLWHGTNEVVFFTELLAYIWLFWEQVSTGFLALRLDRYRVLDDWICLCSLALSPPPPLAFPPLAPRRSLSLWLPCVPPPAPGTASLCCTPRLSIHR